MMNNETQKQTFKEALVSKWKEFVSDWKDPVKRKVRSKNILIFLGKLIRALILIGLCYVILLPIVEKISASFRSPDDLTNTQVVFIPEKFSIVFFRISWELLGIWDTSSEALTTTSSLMNTVVLSTGCMLLQIMSSAVAGYSFARLKFKGNNIIFYIVLATLVVPNETLDISRTLFLTNNTFFGINLMGTIFSMFILAAFGQGIRSAIFIYLFRQFFKNLPVELEESAQVDGAGVIRTFWSIMLPNARGAVVTVGLFSFVWQWNDYYFASLLKYSVPFPLLSTKLAGNTERLGTVLTHWQGYGKDVLDGIETDILNNQLFRGSVANTAALMMMLPLLIGYFFVQKLFVESIERTGIVG